MAILMKDPARTDFECEECGQSKLVAAGFSYDPNSAGCIDDAHEGSNWICNDCAAPIAAAHDDYMADLHELEAAGRLDDNGELRVY